MSYPMTLSADERNPAMNQHCFCDHQNGDCELDWYQDDATEDE